ncbi:hypothetical protein NDU88_005209 [Pleurodeles waltl]|uniref:Uncharacterized protein n=1 Tax=Pleurodeles waltl TaxID=8319 RepID=A0AAV7TUV4_PLEWA|nr:hypothetical protein NDU88_005209 [Pleurodeles waltl]
MSRARHAGHVRTSGGRWRVCKKERLSRGRGPGRARQARTAGRVRCIASREVSAYGRMVVAWGCRDVVGPGFCAGLHPAMAAVAAQGLGAPTLPGQGCSTMASD